MPNLSSKDIEQGTSVALGYFDGIHLGHRAVLNSALETAKEKNLVPVVMLFDIHPRKLVSGTVPPMLMTEKQKREALEKMGFKIYDFDFKRSMDYSPEEFSEKVLIRELNTKAVACGFDYHYGKGGKGSAETLREGLLKRNIETKTLSQVLLKGEAVSSTKIRELIISGNIKKANAMLGTEFSYSLVVEKGDGIGKGLGVPTINQFFPEDFIVPKKGVYASKAKIDGKIYPAVTNIGIRPTVGNSSLRSETCVLDFEGNLYSKEVEVFLLEYLREEMKFPSFEALKEAIERDIKNSRKINEV